VGFIKMTDSDLLKKYGFEEEIWDLEFHNVGPTGFPKPLKRYRVIAEDFNMSIEERYYWQLNYLKEEWGFHDVDKITDIFSAAENSSFFGASQQRLGIQQDKVSSFLAVIGKMIKEIFQLVRELRILDERLGYYKDSYDLNSKSRESAEITLKGIWIDMVEQGSKNPASVYGMARELGFSTLPELFFSAHPLTSRDVDIVVNKLDFNRKLKEVLKRKLRSFLEWKESTFSELKTKRKFTLKYLRQHYDVIKMYMEWVKPYLKNIKKLHMAREKMDSPDIISAFETSFIEIEVLFKKKYGKTAYGCLLLHFDCRTMPAMNYQQEYNKGPLHVGRVDLVIRGYVWSAKQIESYKLMKEEEDFRLLSHIDQSVKQAMDAMGTELAMYLVESGDSNVEGIVKGSKNIIKTPHASIIKGFSEIFGSMSSKKDVSYLDNEKAEKAVKKEVWSAYKDYKKSFGHLAW
jgi:hypothetical protein